MKGQSRKRSWIWFPDGIDHGSKAQVLGMHGKVGIKGISDFGIQDLSIHGVYNSLLIAAPLSRDDAKTYEQLDAARAENVFVHNCYVFLDPIYRRGEIRGHDGTLASLIGDWVLMSAMAFRGDDISVADCDIRGPGACIGLMGCRYTQIARNRLYQGYGNPIAARGDGYPGQPLIGKCIFEDNTMIPTTTAHATAFWCHATSEFFYLARNHIQLLWVGDNEALLWHSSGAQYICKVARAEGTRLVLQDNNPGARKSWECVIIKGKGLGQRRIITDHSQNAVAVDKPWIIEPDASSLVALLRYPCHRRHIIVDNEITDAGAGVYAWGDSYDWIADGNKMTRAGGVLFDLLSVASWTNRQWGGNYFNQVLNNSVDEGRFVGNYVHQNWTLGYSGTVYFRETLKGGTGNLGHIYRGNLHTNDSSLAFWVRVHDKSENYQGPLVDVGMIVEENRFQDCMYGVSLGNAVSGVLKNNCFKNVETPFKTKDNGDLIRYNRDSRTDDKVVFAPPSPVLENVSRHFAEPITLTFAELEEDDVLYYTTDGTEPGPDSSRYTGPIEIDKTTEIKARTYRQAEDAGFSKTTTAHFERIEVTPVRQARINFQPDDGQISAGWLINSGAEFGSQGGATYGWSQNNFEGSRRRGKNTDPLKDTLLHFDKDAVYYWEIALDNGAYDVTICVGDAEYPGRQQKIIAEDKPFCSINAYAVNKFKVIKKRIQVDDGLLTLRTVKTGDLTRMSYLIIEPAVP